MANHKYDKIKYQNTKPLFGEITQAKSLPHYEVRLPSIDTRFLKEYGLKEALIDTLHTDDSQPILRICQRLVSNAINSDGIQQIRSTELICRMLGLLSENKNINIQNNGIPDLQINIDGNLEGIRFKEEDNLE